MGTPPLAYPTTYRNTKFPGIEECLKGLEADRKEAQAAQELAMQRMAQQINSSFVPFEVHQKVLLSTKHLSVKYASGKFSPKREGPYEILEVRQPNVYRLKIPNSWRNVHDVFHASLLTPYRETSEYGPTIPRPPPDIIEGEPEYEVEAIINHRTTHRGQRQYLTRWKGYTDADITWLLATSFKNAKTILDTYLAHHPVTSAHSRPKRCPCQR